MTQDQFEAELLQILSSTEWSTVSQIYTTLKKRLGRLGMRMELSRARVFLGLERQKGTADVESRFVEVPRTLGNPTGKRAEFRLTNRGRKAQAPQSDPQLVGDLVPQPA